MACPMEAGHDQVLRERNMGHSREERGKEAIHGWCCGLCASPHLPTPVEFKCEMKMMVALSVLLLAAAVAAAAPAPALMLERALPLDGVHVDRLKEMDRGRLSTKNGASEFELQGMAGLYFARVKLGNPPKEYSLQFDTGSDIMWVSCKPCIHCPKSSELNFPMELYDPKSSSTSSRIKCSDIGCTYALQTGYAVCNSTHKQCGYSLTYANGGATSGYYVSDILHFDNVLGNEGDVNASALMFFGCSNSRSGSTDGIMGFGKNALSVISQLNARGMSGKVFSHCFKRSEDGGGILVLGEIDKPGFVFTPLVTTQPRYNLNMTSIAVNGQRLPINSSLFATSNAQGTIVDSGTTLSYLADGVYDPVITAISAAISPSVRTYDQNGIRYYVSANSTRTLLSLFPTVTFYFEDGAAMTVGPQNYLVNHGFFDDDDMYRIGFQRSEIEDYKRITILGDIVLRDKIFVYNLDNMSIGWVDYDCSLLNTTTLFVASGSMGHHAPLYYSVMIVVGVAIKIMQHLDYY